MDNNLREKTRKIYNAQTELSELITDLKNEVKDVYNRNQILEEENKRLRKELASRAPATPIITQEPKPDIQPEIKQDIKQPEPIQQEKPDVKVTPPKPVQRKTSTPKAPSAFSEFFLGKNIIAKIATVLIFLGVISFGQLAYVEFLNDVGRVLLILFTGLLVFAIAIFSERKKAIVFSNVFYGLGLYIILYSFILAYDGFNLISNVTLGIFFLILMIGSIIYFNKKRYEFLDIILFTFYFMAVLVFIGISTPANALTGIYVLFALVLGYVVFKYNSSYFKDEQKQKAISLFILAAIYLVTAIFITIEIDSFAVDLQVASLLYGLIGIFIGYTLV